jgi:hypothetical protein
MKFPSIHFPVKTIVNPFYHTCEQKTQKILAVRDAYHRILLDAVDTLVQKCPPAYAGLPALRERIYLGIQLLESFAHTQLETSLCSQFDMESMQTLCLRIAVELLTPPHQTGSDTAVSCSH